MRFVVLGAGAVGGVVGGRLFAAGYEVTLIARGAHHDAIRERGLTLEDPDSSATYPIPVVDRVEAVGFSDDDVLVLAVKSQDSAAALARVSLVAPATMPILCFQNGVDNERLALRYFANVYGVCVVTPTTHLTPGVVLAHAAPVTGILDLGRWPAGSEAGSDPVAEDVAAALRASTFVSEPKADIARWKYAKLLVNLTNAAEAVCGPQARTEGRLRGLLRQEGEACLGAAGIDFARPGEDGERRRLLSPSRPAGGHSHTGGSSWQSLARSAGTVEADYLNGEIVLLGRLHGIATPVNQVLQRCANQMAADGVPPGSMSEDEVLALVQRERVRA